MEEWWPPSSFVHSIMTAGGPTRIIFGGVGGGGWRWLGGEGGWHDVPRAPTSSAQGVALGSRCPPPFAIQSPVGAALDASGTLLPSGSRSRGASFQDSGSWGDRPPGVPGLAPWAEEERLFDAPAPDFPSQAGQSADWGCLSPARQSKSTLMNAPASPQNSPQWGIRLRAHLAVC